MPPDRSRYDENLRTYRLGAGGINPGNVPMHAAELMAIQVRQQAAQAAVNSIDKQATAINIAKIRRTYPTMDPHITAALGLAGHRADDQVTQYVAAASMIKQAKPFWQTIQADDRTRQLEKSNNLVDKWAAKIKADSPDIVDQPYQAIQGTQDNSGGGILDSIGSGIADAYHEVTSRQVGGAQGIDQAAGAGVGTAVGAVTANTQVQQAMANQQAQSRATDQTPVLGDISNAAKGLTRAAGVAGETGYQDIVGRFRNTVEDVGSKGVVGGLTYNGPHVVSPEQQTSGGIAVNQLLSGHPVDAGTGIFPGGQLEAQQAQNSRIASTTNGHATTFGRFAAAQIFEPGTKPYNILSGVVDMAGVATLDPTNKIGGAAEKEHLAKDVFTVGSTAEAIDKRAATGLIDGVRKTIHKPTVNQFLDQTHAGQTWLAKEGRTPAEGGSDFLTLFHKLGDAKTAAAVERADSPGAVREALAAPDALGLNIREAPTAPYTIVRPLRDWASNQRILNTMPKSIGDLNDPNSLVNNADHYLINAKVGRAARNDIAREIATAPTPEAKYSALVKMYQAAEDSLIAHGTDPAIAKSMTRMSGLPSDARHFMTNEAGMDVSPFIPIDGQHEPMVSPAYPIDFLSRAVPFPNIREIRSRTDLLSHVRNLPGPIGAGGDAATVARDYAQIAGDWAIGDVWKPLQVIRPALLTRIMADMATRQVMADQPSSWTHPIQFISHLISNPATIEGVPFKDILEEAQHTGETSKYLDALSGSARLYISNGAEQGRRMQGMAVYNFEQQPAEATRAWHEWLGRLSNDAVAREVAKRGTEGPDGAIQYFTHGKGAKIIWDMIAGPEDATYTLGDRENGLSSGGIRTYINNIRQDLETHTAHDEGLMNAIATGKMTIAGKEVPIYRMNKAGKPVLNRDFARELLARSQQEDAHPDFIHGVMSNFNNKPTGISWNRTMSWLFNGLLTTPMNKFGHSPVFFDNYYKRLGEVAPALSSEHRMLAAQEAENAGYHDIAQTIMNITGEPTTTRITPSTANAVAQAYGLASTKALLHDLSHRGQFFDMIRNIIPFGEAWKELMTKWTRLAWQHPATLPRKFQIGINGARGSGFFYTDENGQEVFNVPGSAWLTKELFGVPVPLTGEAKGLSMLSSGYPGVGPAVQLPAQVVIADTPDNDWIRKTINPFGNQTVPEDNPLFAAVNSLTPSWMDKLILGITGPESNRQYGESLIAIAGYKRSTGDYSNSAADQARLLDDSRAAAKDFWLVRSLASATLPAAPIPKFGVKDVNGDFMMANVLKDEYQKMVTEGEKKGMGIDEIDQGFITKYGLDTFGALTPYTRSLVQALPFTKTQTDWERRNQDLESKYPDTFGFFSPLAKPNDKPDLNAYQRQIDNGQRQVPSVDTWNRMAQDKIAAHLYYSLRDSFGPNPTKGETAQLSAYHAVLKAEYPGFENDKGKVGKLKTADIITQLTAASTDPKILKTPAGKALSSILAVRNHVISEAVKMGVSVNPNSVTGLAGWQVAKSTEGLRRALYLHYAAVRAEYPEASRMLDVVFRNDTRGVTSG